MFSHYKADILTANDYYPFGMQMENRNYTLSNKKYIYGFNGKEIEDPTKGFWMKLMGRNDFFPIISHFCPILCVCAYVCLCVCMCVLVCGCVCVYICVYVSVCVCV